jgi:hypothetical protein
VVPVGLRQQHGTKPRRQRVHILLRHITFKLEKQILPINQNEVKHECYTFWLDVEYNGQEAF